MGRTTHQHIIVEYYLARERFLRDTVLSPGLVVVGQTNEVILLCPRTTLIVLLHRLDLWRISEKMLAFGIDGPFEESTHTDISFNDTDGRTRVLHLLTVFLGQRVLRLLLPLFLVLLDNGIHQQFHQLVDKRLTCGLIRPDIYDERRRLNLTVTILGAQTGSHGSQHGQGRQQRGFLELCRRMVGHLLQNTGQQSWHTWDKAVVLILSVLCQSLFLHLCLQSLEQVTKGWRDTFFPHGVNPTLQC